MHHTAAQLRPYPCVSKHPQGLCAGGCKGPAREPHSCAAASQHHNLLAVSAAGAVCCVPAADGPPPCCRCSHVPGGPPHLHAVVWQRGHAVQQCRALRLALQAARLLRGSLAGGSRAGRGGGGGRCQG